MDEEFESLVVTDPDLVDEGIDISGLRTQTDVSPYLLGNIPDYAGIQYEAFNPSRLSDLMRLYSSGLPAIDTSTAAPPATGGGGSGDGGQATTPITTPTQPDSIAGFDPGVTPGPSGFIGLDPDMDIDPRDIDDYGTYTPPTSSDPFLTSGAAGGARLPTTSTDTGIMVEDFSEPFVDERGITGQRVSYPGDQSGVIKDAVDPQPVRTILGPDGITYDAVTGQPIVDDPTTRLPQLGSVTEEDLVDNRNLLQKLGLPADFDIKRAALEAGINLTVGFPITLLARGLGIGLDALGNIIPQDSLENRTKRSIVDELKSEKDYGFNVQTGTLNQDPFGRNPVSQFGNYEQTLTEDINDPSDTRMGKAKKEFAQDYFDKKAEKASGVEVDEGTVLGPGEAPGDVVSLDDMLREQRDERIDAGIQAADDDKDSDIDTFDTTPVDEFSDEEFMVGDTSTAAPIGGDSGADSFFDAVDTATGGGGGRDRDPDPSPSFDPGGGFVDQGGGGEFGSAPSQPDYSNVTTASAPPGRGGGSGGPPSQGGGASSGGGGCVIATHAVNSGAFTKDTKREAVRWCIKNLHRTWWGEAIRRGYRYYGQKAIEEGKAKNHYQEFKDYVAFGTGKRRTLKTGWTFVYRSIQFFIRGLING